MATPTTPTTPSARAHFLFSRGREMTFRVTGADEVTIYSGSAGMASPWGASMSLVTKTIAGARDHYRSMRNEGWVKG